MSKEHNAKSPAKARPVQNEGIQSSAPAASELLEPLLLAINRFYEREAHFTKVMEATPALRSLLWNPVNVKLFISVIGAALDTRPLKDGTQSSCPLELWGSIRFASDPICQLGKQGAGNEINDRTVWVLPSR